MTSRKPHRRASGGTVPPRPPARRAPESSAAEPSAPVEASPASPVPAEPSVLKAKAAEDDPQVWGDGPEDRDSWLLEQRPPHWD